MKKFLALLLLSALVTLTGCECLSGLGRDMQDAGEWVEDQADQNKK